MLSTALMVLLLLGAAGALAYLATTVDVAVLFTATVVLSVFSGRSEELGIPISPDRVAFAAGMGLLLWRELGGERAPAVRLRWGAVHWCFLLAGSYAVISAAAVGTLTERTSAFALLDRYGLVPFLTFAVAPLVFRTAEQRRILLIGLTGLGAYLGVTALAESTDAQGLIFPRYIDDPAVGIHYGRARGPFVEAGAMGLALAACGTAAALLLVEARRRSVQVLTGAVLLLCAVGVVLTLTRQVWLGAALAALVLLVVVPRLRPLLVPAVVAAGLLVVGTFALVPGVRDAASARSVDERPVWDRLNTDAAAVRMIEERPLVGYGWDTFVQVGAGYLRQTDAYPVTGAGLAVHNVPLGIAVELGLIGLTLWGACFVLGIGAAIWRRPPPGLENFRYGLIALAVTWIVVANLSPLGFAFPTLLLWMWAGIVLGERQLVPAAAPAPRGLRPALAG